MAFPRQHIGQSYIISRHNFGAGETACFEIQCGKCQDIGYAGNSKDLNLPPDAVHQLFRKVGWIVHPRHARSNRCSECQLHPRTSDEKVAAMVGPVPHPPAAPVTPRQLTGYEIRKVSDMLSAQFDDVKGRYESGWSDDKVALDANVPRASVIKLREEGWGKLKVIPEIEALRSEIGDIKTMIGDLEGKLSATEKRLLGRV